MFGRTVFAIDDERSAAARDPRTEYREVVLGGAQGEAVARLPVILVRRIESYSSQARSQLGLEDLTGPVALLGGGLANFCAVAWTRERDSAGRAQRMAELVEKAVVEVRAGGYQPVSVYVPDSDLAAYMAGGDCRVLPTPLGSWLSLELGGARELGEFVGQQGKKVRKVWRRDLRTAAAMGLAFDVVDFDVATISSATPFVAAVSANNDFPEPLAMAKWRLEGYRSRPGDHFFVRGIVADEVVSYTACRRHEDFLEAHTIGIAPGLSDRRVGYHFGTFTAPVQVALASGVRTIGYGPGHEWPKRARGCTGPATFVVQGSRGSRR